LDRPARGCEHERTSFVLRVGEYVFDAGHTTHRLRDEAHVWELQVLDEGGEIAGKFLRIRDADLAPRRISAMRKGDAGIAIRKVDNLLPPGQMITAESMGKYDRGA
jgi:hypothetical protein